MATTTNLLATKIEASQSQKEVTANNAFDVFDKAIAGALSQAITTADVTLTDAQALNAIITLTGTLTGNRNLIVPTRTKIYAIFNNTSGAFTVTVKTAAGTGVVVPQGERRFVYCDGTNVEEIGAAGGGGGAEPEVIIVAISDESTALTTGSAKVTFRMPFAMTLTAVRASLSVASSSGNPTFDVNENGTSIFSTALSIDASEKTSVTAATPAVISDSGLADDAEITIDIDTAGTGAKGAKIYLIGTRA